MDFYFENVVKVGLTFLDVLLLEANLPIIVELACEEQMVGLFNLDVVDRPERMDVSVESFLVLDHSSILLSER